MRILADYTELYIAIIALIFAGLFHFLIMSKQGKSAFVSFCWDVLIFLISLVGISILYYSALVFMASGS